MELNISKLDIGQLLRQALGENDERLADPAAVRAALCGGGGMAAGDILYLI